MSHKIGQVKANNQQSNSNSSQGNQNAQKPEDKTSQSVSTLADADYEFLFNQLLEGIAHGWHDQRIIKFFNKLGDRGKQEDWVAWLERLRTKVLELPLQSKRQLGTLMIRLGELTRSTSEVDKIGEASNLIGRELLFGNTEDVIWEYVGSDIPLDSMVTETETEAELADRLPADFDELGAATATSVTNGGETPLTPDVEANISAETIDKTVDDLDDLPEDSDGVSDSTEVSLESLSPEDHSSATDLLETNLWDIDSAEKPASTNPVSESAGNLAPEELEFEHSDSSAEAIAAQSSEKSVDLDLSLDLDADEPEASVAEPKAEPSVSAIAEPKILGKEFLDSAISQEPRNLEDDLSRIDQIEQIDQPQSGSTIAKEQIESPIQDQSQAQNNDQDAEGINIQRVMSLIQSDPELAEQISHKLNVSSIKLDKLTVEQSEAIKANKIEASGIELIESWFNLGLKQVSTGEFAKAIASWEKALNINPNLSEAWHNRGSALGRLGKYDLAVTSFQNALTIDSQNYQAWNDRAHALYQLEKWEEAVVSWNNALKIMPANHLFWYNRGCGLEQLENWEEAIISYEKSLEIKPDFQPARSRYINLVADNSRAN